MNYVTQLFAFYPFFYHKESREMSTPIFVSISLSLSILVRVQLWEYYDKISVTSLVYFSTIRNKNVLYENCLDF